MQYLERTLQVRAALLERPDILQEIRAVFESHVARDGRETFGKGSSRWVYEVGSCAVEGVGQISLLLKLDENERRMAFRRAASRVVAREVCEFGAFEIYYDFIVGHLPKVEFRTLRGCAEYRAVSILAPNIMPSFKLSDEWGGTRVMQGDLGAVPYFQLAVRYRRWFGWLTEGEPPNIKPKGTAEVVGTKDDDTIVNDRIVDLGPTQCLLIEVDRGGHRSVKPYPGNLGVRRRGEKYFRPSNRLDL